MKKLLLLSITMFIGIAFWGIEPSQAASRQTIRITCWEGYADKAFIDYFKAMVKKCKIDVEVQPSYATGQEDFYNAAKNGTADLISPPADLAKTPRFDLFKKGKTLLAPLTMKNIPNAGHMLPFFTADKSLKSGGKRFGLPYNPPPV